VTGDADIVRHVLGDAYKQFAYGPAESTRRRVEAYEAFDRLVADIERLTAEREEAIAKSVIDERQCDEVTALASEAVASERTLKARAAQLEAALRDIVEHEPEFVRDDQLADDVQACSECARCREREWPPSQMCDKHYTRMARLGDRNERLRASQHLYMRDIALAALSASEKPA
jgi:hypothetical protein